MKIFESIIISTAACLLAFSAITANASSDEFEKPILIIGASYENGATPFNDGLTSPLFGVHIGLGSYLDVGEGITRKRNFVINEAQTGATTFDRDGCNPGPDCGPGKWDGYDVQLNRAIARVFDPVTQSLNADYVIVGMPNDCLHSDAFGIPQSQTSPCTTTELDAVVTAMVDIGNAAIQSGLKPVFSRNPAYADLSFVTAQQIFGFNWVINEPDYEYMRSNMESQLSNLAGAIFVDKTWKGFELLKTPSGIIVDGIHPDFATVKRASRRLLNAIFNDIDSQ